MLLVVIPYALEKYFWDVDAKNLDAQKNKSYIIERVLEYGDTDAVRWMKNIYPVLQIIEVLKRSRALSQKSAHFWALFFEVPESEILCFSKQFRMRSRAIWNR